jgi:hypothetical protein
MIKQFWDWFAKHQAGLRKITNSDYHLIDSILIELRKIQTGLAVEFEKEGDLIIMTISADGVEGNFDIVQEIVNHSPTLDKWNFVAFRQPVSREKINKITITVKDIELDPKKLKFLPITEDDNLYIQIFSETLTDDNKSDIGYGCLMLLDNLIGEYDCVTKVRGYEFYNLSESKDFADDLKPLTEIREFLDNYYKGGCLNGPQQRT